MTQGRSRGNFPSYMENKKDKSESPNSFQRLNVWKTALILKNWRT